MGVSRVSVLVVVDQWRELYVTGIVAGQDHLVSILVVVEYPRELAKFIEFDELRDQPTGLSNCVTRRATRLTRPD